MEGAPKLTNRIEQKEEIKNLEGIDFVFSENPELKKIALESIEPSFNDKKKIFEMLRGILIDMVRDTSEYEKYNGETLAVDNFSEESFELLLQGLEENNINIKPQQENLNKTLEDQTSQEVIPEGADVMDYFNPSTGMFSAFTSEQEKENSLQSTKHSIELLNYFETKDEKAREVYEKYLETIFPESKVKDIVYHGTLNGKFEEFKTNGSKDNIGKLGAMAGTRKAAEFVRQNPDYIYDYLSPDDPNRKPLPENSHIFSLLMNIKNPKIAESLDIAMTYNRKSLDENNYDGVVVRGFAEDETGRIRETGFGDENIVFAPEQIHILGSQKDIEIFKDFSKEKNN